MNDIEKGFVVIIGFVVCAVILYFGFAIFIPALKSTLP